MSIDTYFFYKRGGTYWFTVDFKEHFADIPPDSSHLHNIHAVVLHMAGRNYLLCGSIEHDEYGIIYVFQKVRHD